jgi:hypothetical protein
MGSQKIVELVDMQESFIILGKLVTDQIRPDEVV